MDITECEGCGDYRPAGTACPRCDQDVHDRVHARRGLRQYVAVASFPPDHDDGEEVDLWASSLAQARAVAEAALAADYLPGWRIVALGDPLEVGSGWWVIGL